MDDLDVMPFRGSPRCRIDMNHGFIRSIVQNQIDRDEYHKVVEERQAEIREKLKDRKSKNRLEVEPQTSLYVPPHRRSERRSTSEKEEIAKRTQVGPAVISNTEEHTIRKKVRSRIKAQLDDIDDLQVPCPSSSGRHKNSAKQLFRLNMKNNEGEEVEIPVFSNDSAARLSKELGRKYGFTEEQCRMLRLTLDEALETHKTS